MYGEEIWECNVLEHEDILIGQQILANITSKIVFKNVIIILQKRGKLKAVAFHRGNLTPASQIGGANQRNKIKFDG